MTFLQDLLHGLRSLRHRPGFAAAVVLTLAMGIGVNAAIYTLLRSIFDSPWPVVSDPQGLFALFRTTRTPNGSYTGTNAFSYDDYLDFSAGGRCWKELAAYQWWPVSLASGDANPLRTTAMYVSTNYFDVLGLVPHRGRFFLDHEGTRDDPRFVVVLASAAADRLFGHDADVRGREVLINGRTFEVIGVAPPGFRGTELNAMVDVWLPVTHLKNVVGFEKNFDVRGASTIRLFGRRQPDADLQEVARDARRLAEIQEKTYPVDLKDYGATAVSLADLAINPRSRDAYLNYGNNLRGAVAVLLLVACINVANLLLVRGAEHGRELAVVQALGASRRRVVQRLFGEFSLLFFAAGLLGLPLGWLTLRLLWSLRPPELLSAILPSGLDPNTLLFCTALTLFTVVLCGLLPIWLSSRPSALAALRTSRRAAPSGTVPRKLRNLLLVLQLAVALSALIGAAHFLRNLANTRSVELGFDKDRIAVATIAPGDSGRKPEEVARFWRDALREMRDLPGVEAAALGENRLLRGAVMRNVYYADGSMDPVDYGGMAHRTNVISSDFFKTSGTPLIAGRDFDASDCESCPRVVIINRSFAEFVWPGQSAVGKRVRINEDGTGPPYEVVGVAENARYREVVESPQLFAYLPLSQRATAAATLHLRARSRPEEVISGMMETLRELDPSLPAAEVAPLAEFVDRALWKESSSAFLFSTLALLAVLLSVIGVYSRMAYAVQQRRQEISVRIALGAERGRIFWMILREATLLSVLAATLGSLLSWFVVRPWLTARLNPGSHLQPIDWAVAITLLILAAIAGTFLPARRAAGLAPAAPLREE